MTSIPPVPPDVLDVERSFQTDQGWHQFAFAILPPPFGNRKLLDVGCGGGGVAAHGAGMGWHVTGIDISPKNVEALRRRGFDAEVVDLNGDFPFGARIVQLRPRAAETGGYRTDCKSRGPFCLNNCLVFLR